MVRFLLPRHWVMATQVHFSWNFIFFFTVCFWSNSTLLGTVSCLKTLGTSFTSYSENSSSLPSSLSVRYCESDVQWRYQRNQFHILRLRNWPASPKFGPKSMFWCVSWTYINKGKIVNISCRNFKIII